MPATATIDLKLPMKAGPHTLGVTFVRKPPPGADEVWESSRPTPACKAWRSPDPLMPSGVGDTPSRQRIFVCRPASAADESACAKRILATVARRAFRQPVSDADVQLLTTFYETGRQNGGFDAGIEQGLARVLVDPRFVFRLEREPAGTVDGKPYRISDLELASRLSFFLWSSIPDDQLLDVAVAGKLHEPAVLEQQTRRMLADPKARALVTNFGGQWLYLRELKNARPETTGFSENLRQSLRRETEMLLRKHRARRPQRDRPAERRLYVRRRDAGQALRHSQRARQPVPPCGGHRRGAPRSAWAGQLPAGDVSGQPHVAGVARQVGAGEPTRGRAAAAAAECSGDRRKPEAAKASSLRQKMEIHRGNPTCAACHRIMDPIGFTLENFDLVGRWRTRDGNAPIDATSELFDGTPLDGPVSLRNALLARSDVFVRTATEKLMTYGTGRALKYYDMPVVRQIARDAATNDYRFSSLVLGIVKSEPFQMKMKSKSAP